MPCWTVTTISLVLENADMEILKKALARLGYNPYVQGAKIYWENGEYNKANGTITMRGAKEIQGNAIKKEYTKENVKVQAKRFGWLVTEKQGKLILNKR